MIELTQEVIDAEFGTCYGTCLASILEFPLSAIPQIPRDPAIIEAHHKTQHMGCGEACKFRLEDARSAYFWDMWRDFKLENNIATVRFTMTRLTEYDRSAYSSVYHVLTGISPRDRDLKDNDGRGRKHSVVGKGGRVYWDPHPSRSGLLTIDEIEFILPADPSKPMCKGLR